MILVAFLIFGMIVIILPNDKIINWNNNLYFGANKTQGITYNNFNPNNIPFYLISQITTTTVTANVTLPFNISSLKILYIVVDTQENTSYGNRAPYITISNISFDIGYQTESAYTGGICCFIAYPYIIGQSQYGQYFQNMFRTITSDTNIITSSSDIPQSNGLASHTIKVYGY